MGEGFWSISKNPRECTIIIIWSIITSFCECTAALVINYSYTNELLNHPTIIFTEYNYLRMRKLRVSGVQACGELGWI